MSVLPSLPLSLYPSPSYLLLRVCALLLSHFPFWLSLCFKAALTLLQHINHEQEAASAAIAAFAASFCSCLVPRATRMHRRKQECLSVCFLRCQVVALPLSKNMPQNIWPKAEQHKINMQLNKISKMCGKLIMRVIFNGSSLCFPTKNYPPSHHTPSLQPIKTH